MPMTLKINFALLCLTACVFDTCISLALQRERRQNNLRSTQLIPMLPGIPRIAPRPRPRYNVSNITVGYKYVGCFQDSTPIRLLNGMMREGISNNDPATCASFCAQYGYRLAGVEYESECFCGNNYDNETITLKPRRCFEGKVRNGPLKGCPLNNTQPCGGTLAIAIYEVYNATERQCDPTKQVQCKDSGTCIDKNWLCDGQIDCGDGSDEWDCLEKCPTNKASCASWSITNKPGWVYPTECIDKAWVCDGEFDCADKTDEAVCGSVTCAPNMFRCNSLPKCIPTSYKCDGDPDCPDRSDEENCANNMTIRYTYRGCFADSTDRLLENKNDLEGLNSPAKCMALCKEKGYVIAGVQYGNECFCGNRLQRKLHDLEKVDKMRCFESQETNGAAVGCAMNPVQPCGGVWVMAVFDLHE